MTPPQQIQALEIEINEIEQKQDRLYADIEQLSERKRGLTMNVKANNELLQGKRKLLRSLTRPYDDAARKRKARANATPEQKARTAKKQRLSRKRQDTFEDIWKAYPSYRALIESLRDRFKFIEDTNTSTDYETRLAGVGLFIYSRWQPFRDLSTLKERRISRLLLLCFYP